MQGRQLRAQLLHVLATLIFFASGFGASSFAVELRADPGGAAAGDIVVTLSEIEIPLRLDNDSAETAELTLIARPVRVSGGKPCTEGGGCTIAMYLVGPEGQQKLNPGEERKI